MRLTLSARRWRNQTLNLASDAVLMPTALGVVSDAVLMPTSLGVLSTLLQKETAVHMTHTGFVASHAFSILDLHIFVHLFIVVERHKERREEARRETNRNTKTDTKRHKERSDVSYLLNEFKIKNDRSNAKPKHKGT